MICYHVVRIAQNWPKQLKNTSECADSIIIITIVSVLLFMGLKLLLAVKGAICLSPRWQIAPALKQVKTTERCAPVRRKTDLKHSIVMFHLPCCWILISRHKTADGGQRNNLSVVVLAHFSLLLLTFKQRGQEENRKERRTENGKEEEGVKQSSK